jgi:hypothetical protein
MVAANPDAPDVDHACAVAVHRTYMFRISRAMAADISRRPDVPPMMVIVPISSVTNSTIFSVPRIP